MLLWFLLVFIDKEKQNIFSVLKNCMKYWRENHPLVCAQGYGSLNLTRAKYLTLNQLCMLLIESKLRK